MNTTFDPQVLADDLTEINRIYSRFFATLDESSAANSLKGVSLHDILSLRHG
jgi:hypothetical protein